MTTNEPIKRLVCSCCDGEAIGRQWWNRDVGFGLCRSCIPFASRGLTDADMERTYGKRGVHYDIRENRFAKLATRCSTYRDVTRLWNWADHQIDPESFWAILATVCPWGFDDPNHTDTCIFQHDDGGAR